MTKEEKVVKKNNLKSKQNKKKVSTKQPKENYFKLVKKELKLVKWPKFKEVLKYTISTIVFCAFLCGVFMFLDLIMSMVKGWFV